MLTDVSSPVGDRVQELQRNLHFTITKTLQENERFNVYLIRHEGEARVLKISVEPECAQNLEQDIRMSMFLMTLGRANTTTTYRVRNIFDFGRGWFIGEYFDAPPLLSDTRPEVADKVVHVARNIWAPFLAEAASYTPFFLQQRPFYISAQGIYTKQYYERHDELLNWSSTARAKGLITDQEIRLLMDYIEGNARVISTGLELIDVKPRDALLLKNDIVGLVDLEYATVTGRQCFDVAWSYLRFWVDNHSPEAARAFLQSYMDHSVYDIRSFAPPFLTSLGMKLLGHFYDQADYMGRAERGEDNTEPPYSKEELREMLEAYLQFNVKALV